MMKKSAVFLVVAFFLGFAAEAFAADTVRVVASFSILGDMAQVVGGNDVSVTTLVGANGDAHAYVPDVAAAKAVAQADVVFVNGLGFDAWVEKLAASSDFKGQLIVVSEGVTPRTMDEAGRKMVDPHAWQDLSNARLYAKVIAQALSKAKPEADERFQIRARKYDGALQQMDAFVRMTIGSIPKDRRKVITSHDAFGYFGAAYDITFLAPAGLSNEAEPSAAGVAALIDQIKQAQIKTIFVENVADPRLIKQIAREAGASIGKPLYSDALSEPRGVAGSYLAMVHYNMKQMKDAMRQ